MEAIITDIVWIKIEALIPVKTKKVGQPKINPKQVLRAIIFMIKTGIQWRYLPRGFGAKSTILEIS